MKITSMLCVLMLTQVSMAYEPGRFNSSDNISLGDIAPKLADAVGAGLVDTGSNATNFIDYFVMLIFFFIVICIIKFGKDAYQTWRKT